MKLSEFKKKYNNIFKGIKENNQYIVYYANTETCAGVAYISIIKDRFTGYISEDNKGYNQELIKAGTKKNALINHLFMNNDIYTILQGIEKN